MLRDLRGPGVKVLQYAFKILKRKEVLHGRFASGANFNIEKIDSFFTSEENIKSTQATFSFLVFCPISALNVSRPVSQLFRTFD